MYGIINMGALQLVQTIDLDLYCDVIKKTRIYQQKMC